MTWCHVVDTKHVYDTQTDVHYALNVKTDSALFKGLQEAENRLVTGWRRRDAAIWEKRKGGKKKRKNKKTKP